MRVSEYYGLRRNQASLDFLDVDTKNDVKLFLSPSAIGNTRTSWGQHCDFLIKDFFEAVVGSIRGGNEQKALDILLELRESNETHLGLSIGVADGRGLGPKKARKIWQSFKRSKAVKSGLMEDLEDSVLLIDGISTDNLSDIVTNIIREPLIDYTEAVCEEYGIPLEDDIASGVMWDSDNHEWYQAHRRLPVIDEKVLLVPKSIIRIRGSFDVDKYYRNYILPALGEREKQLGTGLVRRIKSGKNKGQKRVYKKDLKRKFGSKPKAVSVVQTDVFPEAFKQYKHDHSTPPPTLSHEQIASSQGIPLPDWDGLLQSVCRLEPGRKNAYLYEDAIKDLLYALFYPELANPTSQSVLHEGLKRVDIVFDNQSNTGFFKWLSQHYRAPKIFVECKNFGSEIGNPEIDQLAMRFSDNRGRFGILVCRSVENEERLMKRCKAAAADGHGFAIVLTDQDLVGLVDTAKGNLLRDTTFPQLQKQFDQLIM